jgi:hypothetical protein
MSVALFDPAEFGQPGRLEHPSDLDAGAWSERLYGQLEAPPVEPPEPGACCHADGRRERLGRVSLCAECVARRLSVVARLASDIAAASERRVSA